MKRLLFATVLTIIFSSDTIAQNYIYFGDNRYEATPSWMFSSNYGGGLPGSGPELTVAKRSDVSGYLMISISVPIKTYHLSGTVRVFLDDGSIIKCTDRGIRDHVDGQSISLYRLTTKELEKLKYSHISKIRYNLVQGNYGYESFTASNERTFFYSFDSKSNKEKYYTTDNDIRYLFNN